MEAGAKLAARPRDVAAAADIIFMCLTDAAAVEEVVFGADGLATVDGRGKLVVDFSSIHPDAARAIAARLKAANGMGWIDAPVSGGSKGAEEGTLAVMAGGDAADIERVQALRAGDGAAADAYGPGRRGANHKTLQPGDRRLRHDGARGGHAPCGQCRDRRQTNCRKRWPAASPIPFRLQLFVPRMVQGIHSPPLGHISTMLKDLDTVVDVARNTSSPVPMSALAAQLFRLAKSARGADADALEIYKLSAKQTG